MAQVTTVWLGCNPSPEDSICGRGGGQTKKKNNNKLKRFCLHIAASIEGGRKEVKILIKQCVSAMINVILGYNPHVYM